MKNPIQEPLAAILIVALSLTACGFDSHEVRTWGLPAKQDLPALRFTTHLMLQAIAQEGEGVD